MSGCVYLVGAGPGDPGLLTLRGCELLGRADVVLFDGLCNRELLRHAHGAKQICVGKHGQSRIWRQSEIIEEMLRYANDGCTVVRLKGGDPAIFARTSEEVDALQAAGIPFEIVPGITTALAAGAYAGIPVTDRGLASAVALVTGHEERGKTKSSLDWDALASFPGTLVVYMGVTTAESWTTALLDAGKPAETPTAIIRRCTHPDQQTIRCRLDEVSQILSGQATGDKLRPPIIVVIGAVTELAETMNWMSKRPLFGKSIVVSRPADQAESLAAPLRNLGASVLLQPAIEIAPPDDWSGVDRAIEGLAEYDHAIFCSHNGVRFFVDRLLESGRDIRALAGVKIAAVGSKTAETLDQYHIHPDVVPADFRAESLAEQLACEVCGKRVLVIRASRGSTVLADKLQPAGALLTQVIAYSHTDVATADPEIMRLVAEGSVDWITVTSSATAENLVKLFGESINQTKIASLSPVTSKALASLGFAVAAEAKPYTIESLVDSIVLAENRS